MPSSKNEQPADIEPQFNLLAPVLAWLLPGLGHFSLGYRRRGSYLLISIASLYLGGLLIGGVDVIDRRENRWWYYGQVLAGPVTPLIDFWLTRQLITSDAAGRPLPQPEKPAPPLPPDDPAHDPNYRPAFSVSLGRINEVGTLFTTLAGMLNLIAILDVIYLAPAAASAAAAAAGAGAAAGGPRGTTRVPNASHAPAPPAPARPAESPAGPAPSTTPTHAPAINRPRRIDGDGEGADQSASPTPGGTPDHEQPDEGPEEFDASPARPST